MPAKEKGGEKGGSEGWGGGYKPRGKLAKARDQAEIEEAKQNGFRIEHKAEAKAEKALCPRYMSLSLSLHLSLTPPFPLPPSPSLPHPSPPLPLSLSLSPSPSLPHSTSPSERAAEAKRLQTRQSLRETRVAESGKGLSAADQRKRELELKKESSRNNGTGQKIKRSMP
jgi:hypothetical protein